MRYAQDFGFTFPAHIICFAVYYTMHLSVFLELTHASLSLADNMLPRNMLAELKSLTRNHGLATGSQTVPNSAVEKAIVHGRSPPKEPTQRKKLVLKRPKRKAPQVGHEEEEEDDEVTEDGLVTKRKRVTRSSPPAPPVSYTHLTLPTNREV